MKTVLYCRVSTLDQTVDHQLTQAHQNGFDLQYFVTGLPKDASQSEKNDRIAELADKITNIKESDVFVISMWIGED